MSIKMKKISARTAVIVIILGIVAIGGIYEPKRHIDSKYTGYLLNKQNEEIKAIEIAFDGVYNRKLDQFNGTITIDKLKLKNIVAKNNSRVFTLSDDKGMYHEYGSIAFTKAFDSIEFQIIDKRIIEILDEESEMDEPLWIIVIEEK
jgi:hypothetical protein